MEIQIYAIGYLIYYAIILVFILTKMEKSYTTTLEYMISPFAALLVSVLIPIILVVTWACVKLLWTVLLIAVGGVSNG